MGIERARILIVNKYFPPDTANTAQLLGELAEDLSKCNQVEVVVGRPSYDPRQPESRQAARVAVRTVPSSALGRSNVARRAVDYVSFLALALLSGMLAARPDVVMALSDPPGVGVIGALVARRHRCPFVLVCHDLHPDITIALGKMREGFTTRLWRSANRRVYEAADRIVVVGRDMQEKLAKEGVGREKVRFVPTWATAQEETSPAAVARARSARGWDGRFVVMHAGNMGLSQNLLMYPDVARALLDLDDVIIVFLGDGPAKPKLLARCADLPNIRFLSRLPKSDAQRLMAAADIHVVSLVPGLWGCAAPSKTYGIMAAGRPFIASVDPGSEPARIVGEFGCGFVVTPGSATELAEAIRSAQGAPLAEMGRKAKAGFESRYERASATGAIAAVLAESVGGAAHA